MCGQQRNSPMADPIFGSKYGPQNGVQNWITFSFLLLGLCLGPVLGSRFGPKSGVSHRRILLLPGEVLQADLRRTSMSVSVNTCFFSLCVPLCFLYSTIQSEKETHDPYAQTLLLTAPGCPTESATGSRQCYSLQCSLVHGSGRLLPTPLTEQDRRARGTGSQDSQDKKQNEFKNKPTSKRYARGGGCHGGKVCVH